MIEIEIGKKCVGLDIEIKHLTIRPIGEIANNILERIKKSLVKMFNLDKLRVDQVVLDLSFAQTFRTKIKQKILRRVRFKLTNYLRSITKVFDTIDPKKIIS